ncbi:MAG: DUF421 domain-containing protein [Thermoactinomyces sp.]
MSWYGVVIKTIFTVLLLLAITRILGKRQVTQLSLFEYITGITLGSIAAYIPLEAEKTAWYLGALSLLVWVMMAIGIEYLQIKSKKIRELLDGKETVLIREGKVLEDNLKKERMTINELVSQLRKRNVFRLADVEFAIMEPDGSVNVMLKKERQPVTAKMLEMPVAREREPEIVVMDGKIQDESLFRLGRNRKWLKEKLERQGVALENVFLAQVDSFGDLYLDLYDDQLQKPVPQDRAQLLATLKKCEADLELFGLSTGNEEAKKIYLESAQELEQAIREVKPYLMQ